MLCGNKKAGYLNIVKVLEKYVSVSLSNKKSEGEISGTS